MCGPKGAIDPMMSPTNDSTILVETAACRNHCHNGAPGQLSTCA